LDVGTLSDFGASRVYSVEIFGSPPMQVAIDQSSGQSKEAVVEMDEITRRGPMYPPTGTGPMPRFLTADPDPSQRRYS
jgi:hypothetical protein